MTDDRLREVTASLMTVVALGIVGYLAIVTRHEAAIGALIGIVSIGAQWFLRGRVETPKK